MLVGENLNSSEKSIGVHERIRDGNATGHDVADPTLWRDPQRLGNRRTTRIAVDDHDSLIEGSERNRKVERRRRLAVVRAG